MPLPRIVVADDNPDILNLVSRRLARRGYDVLPAADGRAALDLIRAERPAAAVVDWLMPELRGPEVCRLVKEDPETAHIAIVLLTAKASEGDVSSGFDAGADEYLTKPFDIEELDHLLRGLIGSA